MTAIKRRRRQYAILVATAAVIPVNALFLTFQRPQSGAFSNTLRRTVTTRSTEHADPSITTTSLDHVASSQRPANQDSMDQFQEDIHTVLHNLRASNTDSTVPALFRRDNNGGPSFSKTWTLDDWERHSSRRRYLDYIQTFFWSRMFRRVLPQLSVLVIWSMGVVWLEGKTNLLHIPLAPLSLVSTFVAALLTLRSNQGLGRLAQGRAAMRSALWNARHMSQLLAASVYPRNHYLALKALRHVALFAWLIKDFMRHDECPAADADIINAMLSTNDAAFVMHQRKKPVAVISRLRQIFAYMAAKGQLSTAEQVCLDHTVQQLNDCITTCERIRASPIPPLYTAHTGLLLTFYLCFLPLALQGSGLMQPLGTVMTTAVVGYAMLGLDEISHILEQPFKLMPLYQQSKTSMMDVADAIVERPPGLLETEPWNHLVASAAGDG